MVTSERNAASLLMGLLILFVGLSVSGVGSNMEELVYGNNAFAFDLYQVLREGDGNLFFSPYSISLALAMTYAGACGQTQREMAKVLRFTLPPCRLHAAHGSLNEKFSTLAGSGLQLHIANSIWGQLEHPFFLGFLGLLEQHYGSPLREVDFRGQPEGSRQEINQWVSEATEGKIGDLIPASGITPFTRLVLANAIYFNAQWQNPFAKEDTREGVFHLLDGTDIFVPMMHQKASFRYAAGDGWQAVELPYVGMRVAMLILLPDQGQFEEFDTALDERLVKSIVEGLGSEREISLVMPKFSYEAAFTLSEALIALGMETAFDEDRADFFAMDGTRDLSIDEVYHKAFVAVDEVATEAAAATAVVVGLAMALPPPPTVRVDRPFVFLIRDRTTDSILFVGRVLDPR